jgi:hypothetical protein
MPTKNTVQKKIVSKGIEIFRFKQIPVTPFEYIYFLWTVSHDFGRLVFFIKKFLLGLLYVQNLKGF